MSLSSTTAPGKLFASRTELQTHYKSDWHRYNLKRRENNLPMLNEEEFNARLEAALALRKEREGREERSGLDHLKVCVTYHVIYREVITNHNLHRLRLLLLCDAGWEEKQTEQGRKEGQKRQQKKACFCKA
jgi:hypothetical protein